MKNIKWKNVTPMQDNWQEQIDLYHNKHGKLGSIVYCEVLNGWNILINGNYYYAKAKTRKEAKRELIRTLRALLVERLEACNKIINEFDEILEVN